ncbi:MAG TPA: hypothetical protein VHK27_07435, partial [Gammaproteobacteria bacterium]|nr:hypothetical protein [Gammaproteobacteria bacterium]
LARFLGRGVNEFLHPNSAEPRGEKQVGDIVVAENESLIQRLVVEDGLISLVVFEIGKRIVQLVWVVKEELCAFYFINVYKASRDLP